jgi:hypothetical protein
MQVMQVTKAWNRYWFAPAPYLDLAVVRIVAVGFLLYESIFRTSIYGLAMDSAALPDAMWQPLIIMKVLNLPFGWGMRPSVEVIQWFHLIWLVTGVFTLVGLFTRSSIVVFAATYVYLQSFVYSFGDFHHPEAVMAVAISVLALSPCGRVLSVDALVRQRRQGAADDLFAMNEFAGWPLKLLQWFFVLMYLSAVWSKLSASGLDWANGYTLQFYLARDGLRFDRPLGVFFSQFHILALLMQIGVLLFQATFWAAVVFPKLRWIYIPLGLCFHTGIYLTLQAPFFHWIALYVVFIPWSEALRRWRQLPRAGPLLRRTSS